MKWFVACVNYEANHKEEPLNEGVLIFLFCFETMLTCSDMPQSERMVLEPEKIYIYTFLKLTVR